MKKPFWIFCLAGFLVLCGALFTSIYISARNDAIRNLNAQHSLHAEQAAEGITDFFENWFTVLSAYSQMDNIIELSNKGKQRMAVLYETNKHQIQALTRVDAKGQIVYTVPEMPGIVGRDISGQAHIREIMETHRPVVSDVFKAVQGFDTVAIHVPVIRHNTYYGTIGIAVNFSALSERYLDTIRIGKTGYAWMISRNGTELYCPVPGHTGHSVYDNCRDFPSILAMADAMTKGRQGVTTYRFDKVAGKTVTPVTKHAVYRPIPIGNTFWSIVVASSEEEALAPLTDFRNKLLLIVALFFMGTVVFAYYGLRARFLIREAEKRKEGGKVLQEEHRRLDAIIESLPDATFVIDQQKRVIAWNRAMEVMTGVPKADMLGKSDYEYALPFYSERRPILVDLALSPDDLFLRSHYTLTESRGDTLSAEAYVPNVFGGSGAFLWIHACVLRSGDGRVIGAIESIRDMTDRKTVENTLRTQESKISSIFLAAPVGIGMAVNRIIKEANETLCHMTGYSREELLDQSARMLYPTQEDYDYVGREKYRQIAEKHVGTMETCWRKKDGAVIRIILSSAPLDLDDLSKGVTFTALDITDRVRMEDERQRMEERLRRAEKMEALGLLSGGVAHDLNNVLGIIVGYAELLLHKLGVSDPLKPYATQIMGAAERAAATIQDMLTLARRGVQSRKTINLNDLITQFLKTPELDNLLAANPLVQVITQLDADTLNIWGTPYQLCKTFTNLVSNAMDAMPKGGVLTITTSNQYLDRPLQGYDEVLEGDYVVLSVTDTGEGIAAADIRHIFEPFYTKKVMGRSGTGLGLAVVWGTIKDHGGYIDVKSEEGKGSIFRLYFPVIREEIQTEPAALPVHEYMGRGEAILVVDDVDGQRKLAAEMLTRLNYRVSLAGSGEEALDHLRRQPADLVVLDMIMDPGMDGLDAYRHILEIHPQQRAIIVSGFADTERVRTAQALGAGAYLKKPYVLEKLGVAVRKELDKRS